jgi:hypothetical protein
MVDFGFCAFEGVLVAILYSFGIYAVGRGVFVVDLPVFFNKILLTFSSPKTKVPTFRRRLNSHEPAFPSRTR